LDAETGEVIDEANSNQTVQDAEVDLLTADNDLSSDVNDNEEGVSLSEKTEELVVEEPEVTEATIEAFVLLDESGVKITAKGLDTSKRNPELKILIENQSDKNLTVQALDTSINGYMVDNALSVDVLAGKKANATIPFLGADLKNAGIEQIAEIELAFDIFDTESWDSYVRSKPLVIKTSLAENYNFLFDDSGALIYNEKGVKIVAKDYSYNTDGLKTGVRLYIENNTDHNIIVQSSDVSVNGFMIDPVLSPEITKNKHAIADMEFYEDELEENEIVDFDEIELRFAIIVADDIFDYYLTDYYILKPSSDGIKVDKKTLSQEKTPQEQAVAQETEEDQTDLEPSVETIDSEGSNEQHDNESIGDTEDNKEYKYYRIFDLLGSTDKNSDAYNPIGGKKEFKGKKIETTGRIYDGKYDEGYIIIENLGIEKSKFNENRIICYIKEGDKERLRFLFNSNFYGYAYTNFVVTVKGTITEINGGQAYEMYMDDAYFPILDILTWEGQSIESLHTKGYLCKSYDEVKDNPRVPLQCDEVFMDYEINGVNYNILAWYKDGICCMIWAIANEPRDTELVLDDVIAYYSQIYQLLGLTANNGLLHSDWVMSKSLRSNVYYSYDTRGEVDIGWVSEELTINIIAGSQALSFAIFNSYGNEILSSLVQSP